MIFVTGDYKMFLEFGQPGARKFILFFIPPGGRNWIRSSPMNCATQSGICRMKGLVHLPVKIIISMKDFFGALK